MIKKWIFIVLVMLSIPAFAAIPSSEIEVTWNPDPLKVEIGKTITTTVEFRMPAGWFVYVDKTDLEFVALEGIRVLRVDYPKPAKKEDPLGTGTIDVFLSGSTISVELLVPPEMEDGIYEMSAILHYQGCTDKVCLRPVNQDIDWSVYAGDVSEDLKAQAKSRGMKRGFSSLFDLFKGKGSDNVLSFDLKWLFLIAFLGGILSSFTPCILPLIPVTMLIIGVNPKTTWKSNLRLSLALVLGMSVTYAALGIAAAALGTGLGFLFQSRLFLLFVIFFFTAMGLSLLGIYTFQLPLSFRNALSKLGGGGGVRGAFFAGISMGLLATPCVGPVVGALLVYAATAHRPSTGFFLLLVYGLGLGVVILMAGTWYGTIIGRLKKARMKWAKKFIGLLLIGAALYYLHSLVPYTALFMTRADHPIAWQESGQVVFQDQSKPKMVLFTAKWCPPCKILDAFVLKSPEVVELSERFQSIKIDTTYVTHENEEWVEKYRVQGWPTILFLSPDGDLYGDLTIFGGYIRSAELTDHMEKALVRSGKKSGT